MKSFLLWVASFVIIIFSHSCFSGGITQQAITGSSGEVLVIMDNWNSSYGKEVQQILEDDTPFLPRPEPLFDISHISKKTFDGGMFQSTRNILEVAVSNIYRESKISFHKNIWAQPQAYIKAQAPNEKSMCELLEKNKDEIRGFFLKAELSRYASYYTKYPNTKFKDILKRKFGIIMSIPASLIQYKDRPNFFWMYNGRAEEQQNLFVFSVPYTNPNMLDSSRLNLLCDSISKKFLPGTVEGTYVSTEYKTAIIYKAVDFRGAFCAKMRGQWSMTNDFMGGPFVRWARVNTETNHLVVVQGFVYAPGRNKRNNIRQLEAIIGTWAFDYELN